MAFMKHKNSSSNENAHYQTFRSQENTDRIFLPFSVFIFFFIGPVQAGFICAIIYFGQINLTEKQKLNNCGFSHIKPTRNPISSVFLKTHHPDNYGARHR